jgi:Ca-activated chloride channel family protein
MIGKVREKPPCSLCEEEESGLESIAEDLLYSLFNPYHREKGQFNVSEFIKEHIEKEESRRDYEIFKNTFNEIMKSFGYVNMYWLDKLEEFKQAKMKAWQELKEMLKRGELKRDDISPSDIVDNFLEEVIEELAEMGYIKSHETRFHRRVVYYSKRAEKVLGEKVLALSLQNLDKKEYGEHETEKPGVSIFVGEKLVEFDPFLHSFDALDIIESLLKSAVRGEIEFREDEFVARQPKHSEKCVYVMLIDVSDSMRGRKIIGAIEAALALKRAIKKKGSSDELRVVAFNHKVREIKQGEILNLEARGRTDIGLALRKAREILSRSSGTGIVFLISDGEPTSSFNPYLTPWRCSLKEAENLRKVDAKLQIIMFGKEGRFLELCKTMAKLSGKANVFHFADPLNLKKFVVKSYMR